MDSIGHIIYIMDIYIWNMLDQVFYGDAMGINWYMTDYPYQTIMRPPRPPPFRKDIPPAFAVVSLQNAGSSKLHLETRKRFRSIVPELGGKKRQGRFKGHLVYKNPARQLFHIAFHKPR